MRHARARGRRLPPPKPKDWLWVTASVAVRLSGGAGTQQVMLCEPADWQVGATVAFERSTLWAIRGWLGVETDVASTPTDIAAVYMAITRTQTGAAPMNPASLAQYDDHDILYTDGVDATNVSLPAGLICTRQIDIKVKRKLDSQTNIDLVLNQPLSAAGRSNVVGILRCLVNRS